MGAPLYETPATIEKRPWHARAGVLALSIVSFFFMLGGVPLLGKDEPRYAQVAREMVESGDWITPHLAGHVWFEKPALPYWLMAAAYEVFGVSEFSARLGAALLALAGVFAVYVVGRRAGGERLGISAAVVLATSALWFAFARAAAFDMPLAATMAGALACFYLYDTSESRRSQIVWAVASGSCVGASALAKGLVGPVLLGGIVVAYLVTTAAWRRVRAAHLLAATVAALAVAAVWYVPVYLRNGWPFVEEFIVNHHFRRYLTNKYHHPQPIYFYLLVVAGGLLPWTFLLATEARALIGRLCLRPVSNEDRMIWLAALWVMVPLLFFSASTSKLPGYILPVFPALALLAGWAIERTITTRRAGWAWYATGATLAGLGVGLAVYGGRSLGAPVWEVVAIGLPCVAAGVAVAVAGIRGQFRLSVWTAGIGMAAAVVLVTTCLFPALGLRESLADLSQQAGVALLPGERVVLLGVVEYSPVFYVDGRVVLDDVGEIQVADSFDQIGAAVNASRLDSVLCVTNERHLAEIENRAGFSIEWIARQRDRVLVRVRRNVSLSPP